MNVHAHQPTLVIIDDEPQVRKLLKASLPEEHYKIYEAETGQLGLMEIVYRKPDAVLLDLGLPDMDGIEVVKRLREWSAVPIIILSVREGIEDKVLALDAGADDYLTKPFHSAELLARLRAVLRHSQNANPQPIISTGPLQIDLNSRQVTFRNQEVHLTTTEYALLKILAINIGKVVTQPYLLKEVWGPNGAENTHYLRVYMRYLRKKIELDPSLPKMLINEPGIGYRLRACD